MGTLIKVDKGDVLLFTGVGNMDQNEADMLLGFFRDALRVRAVFFSEEGVTVDKLDMDDLERVMALAIKERELAAEEDTPVKFCSWCPVPANPDPAYHPDGKGDHRPRLDYGL